MIIKEAEFWTFKKIFLFKKLRLKFLFKNNDILQNVLLFIPYKI